MSRCKCEKGTEVPKATQLGVPVHQVTPILGAKALLKIVFILLGFFFS